MIEVNARTVKAFWANGYSYPEGFDLRLSRTTRDEWLRNEWIELVGDVKGKKQKRKRDAKGHFLPIVRTG